MSDKIYVQIDDEKIEATGAALTEYLEYKAMIENAAITAEANAKAKAKAKASLRKLRFFIENPPLK